MTRRISLTKAELVERKSAYDREYRKRDPATLKARKAAYYKANADRDKERAARKRRAPQHAEYCRRPEYVAWKREYDQIYRARQDYGPFADAALALLKLQGEINSRATWLEIAASKGTLNKSLQRKREYGKRSISETIRSEPQECTLGNVTVDPEGPASARRR